MCALRTIHVRVLKCIVDFNALICVCVSSCVSVCFCVGIC